MGKTVTSLGREKLLSNARRYQEQGIFQDFIDEAEWVLSPSLAYGGNLKYDPSDKLVEGEMNGYGVYIHSSARNFNKFLEQHNFISEVEYNLSRCLSSFLEECESLKQLVKPDPKMRTDKFLNLFKKTESEELFNGLKDLLLTIKSSPILRAYESFKKVELGRITGKSKRVDKHKEDKPFLSITVVMENGAIKTVNKNYVKTRSVAYRNLAKALGVSESSKDGTPQKMLYDQIADIVNDEVKEINIDMLRSIDNLVYQVLDIPTITVGGIQLTLPQCFQAVQDILKKIESSVSSNNKVSYDAFMQVANLNDFHSYKSPKGKQGNFFSDMGLVFEELLSYLWKQEVWTKDVVNIGGEKSVKDYNTADLEIDLDETIKLCESTSRKVTASLKHTVNFEKEKFLRPERLMKILGPEVAEVPTLINQYKYFILNYSLLSNAETRDRMYSGSVNQKSEWGHNVADVPLLSLPNVVQLYQIFADTLGRIFLTMSLIGDVYSQSNPVFSEDKKYDLPKLLITTEYAIFTYDVLDRLLELIDSGGAEVQAVPYLRTSLHKTLVERKAVLTRKKKKGSLHSYEELIKDADVREKMRTINRSAFVKSTTNKKTDVTTYTEGIKITSSVNLAMIVEKFKQGTKR